MEEAASGKCFVNRLPVKRGVPWVTVSRDWGALGLCREGTPPRACESLRNKDPNSKFLLLDPGFPHPIPSVHGCGLQESGV